MATTKKKKTVAKPKKELNPKPLSATEPTTPPPPNPPGIPPTNP